MITPPDFGGGHFFIPPTAIGSVPNLSGHIIGNRWRSLSRVRRHRANNPQHSSSNRCCLFRFHHGPINVRLSFPTPTIIYYCWYVVGMCDIQKNIGGCCRNVENHKIRTSYENILLLLCVVQNPVAPVAQR